MLKLYRGLTVAAILLTTLSLSGWSGGGVTGKGVGNFHVASPFVVTDYTASMTILLDFESSGAALGDNDTGTSCGSTCDYSAINAPTRSTGDTNFREGLASGTFVAASSQVLECLYSNCGSHLNFASSDFTCGFWVRANISANTTWMSNAGITATESWSLVIGSGDKKKCGVGSGTFQLALEGTSNSILDQWAFMTCGNDGVDTLGEVDDDTGNETWSLASGNPATFTEDFHIAAGGTTSQLFDGDFDEMWCLPVAITPAQRCRICSCGVKGDKADGGYCTASSATAYSDTGRNAQTCVSLACSGDDLVCANNNDCGTCNSCTLPDSTGAAP